MHSRMTDQEYDVLDELYFLSSFKELAGKCNLETEKLKEVLESLLEKGWIKCFKDKDQELHIQELTFEKHYDEYNYLATKSGLFAHNSTI